MQLIAQTLQMSTESTSIATPPLVTVAIKIILPQHPEFLVT